MSDTATSHLNWDAEELKAEILQALATPDNSVAPFACHGKVNWAVNPGLKSMVLGCAFGKGEQTVVDDSVRRSWELNPSEFKITNPAWTSCVNDLVTTIHYQLGLTCGSPSIHAELYKMLIYEPGAFFKAHQDSEKTPGMFGTLVICLPSQHQGGRVVLSHNKNNIYYDTALSTPLDPSYGAWYSDVYREVEEVTSGYRVVLTFNLVQAKHAVAQKAPDADVKARLRRALEAWDDASINEPEAFPPHLVQMLEHQYSEKYIALDALKGPDFRQVDVLREACEEAGWDIYLATHEKTLHGDDEWDVGDDFDREDQYKNIVRIDGESTKLKPDYDRDCYLDDTEYSDGEADESEHEGYTGNEGAPATFWYRKYVALLVPPSRSFEFGLTPENKNDIVLETIEKLTSQLDKPEVKRNLYTLCNIVLQLGKKPSTWPRRNTYDRYGSSDDSNYGFQHHGKNKNKRSSTNDTTSCEKEIAKIALEQDWLDVFDIVPITHKIDPEVLEALGCYIRQYGVDAASDSLNAILQKFASINGKHQALEKIIDAFNPADECEFSQQLQDDFEGWRSSAIQDVLITKERIVADDGTALAKIAKSTRADIAADVLIALASATTKTVSAFIIEFAKDNENIHLESQEKSLRAAIHKLWSEFSFQQRSDKLDQSTNRSHSYYRPGYYDPKPPPVDCIDFNTLGPLLTITKEYCGGSTNEPQSDANTITAPSALQIMSDAVRDAPDVFVQSDLLAFILHVVSHKYPALIVGGDSSNAETESDLFDALSHFITTALTTAIRRQGPEPQRPTNWTKPVKSCGCEHCEVIAKFMKDPARREISYPTAQRNRRHLDDQYMYSGLVDITIGTDKNHGSPHRWACRKDHTKWGKDHTDWQRKYMDLLAKIRKIDCADGNIEDWPESRKAKGTNGVLKNWLGEYYDAIMKARVESLPGIEESSNSPDSDSDKPLNELSQSGVNERHGRKRGLEDNEGEENVKRPRTDEGQVEVIDLT